MPDHRFAVFAERVEPHEFAEFAERVNRLERHIDQLHRTRDQTYVARKQLEKQYNRDRG